MTYDRDANGARVERRGGGGLVTALRGLRDDHDVTWIASATTDEDRVVAAEAGGEVVLVAHDSHAYDLYYNVVANPMLWFIQHSLWGPAFSPVIGRELHEAWRDGYEVVNRTFADAVVAQLDNTPDATVFFHDYHLYLAPRMVREARPDAKLAHFVHIPWPVDWTTLPPAMRSAVHDGLLANNVVGFHTARWARNFERSCADLARSTDGTLVTHHAISVDVAEFDALRESEPVLAAEASLDRPEKLIVRVDRTDPSKNIARGFRAFGILLDEHPEWRGRVKMLARLDPSRETIPEYVEYRAAIEAEDQPPADRAGPAGTPREAVPGSARRADPAVDTGRSTRPAGRRPPHAAGLTDPIPSPRCPSATEVSFGVPLGSWRVGFTRRLPLGVLIFSKLIGDFNPQCVWRRVRL